MKLKYYGTTAAEGFPGIFCECKYCKRARELGGKNFRSRSQALVDGTLLIDFPPDTLYHVYSFGLPLHKIRDLIITHNHSDHLYSNDLCQRIEGYAYFDGEEFPLRIYGSKPTIDTITERLVTRGVHKQKRWELIELCAFETYSIGGFEVTPLKANHDITADPFIYDIKKDGKRMLYGNDTGIFPDETWEYIEKNKLYYDLVSLDCTGGIVDIDYSCHMNLKRNIHVKDRLLQKGNADKNTIFVLQHFSHNGGAVYDDFSPLAEKDGFVTAYDGMEIEY